MNSVVDIGGLDELVTSLRSGAVTLEALKVDGAEALALIERWSDRARFSSLLDERRSWVIRAADDLLARADGMSAAETLVDTAARGAVAAMLGGGLDVAAYREMVREAVTEIEDLLETGGTSVFGLFSIGDTDISDDELRAIAEILMALRRPVLSGVLAALGSETLERWLEAIEDGDVDPGVHRELFEHIVNHGGARRVSALLRASRATTQTLLLDALESHGTAGSQIWVLRDILVQEPDEARIAIEVLALMDLPTRSRALELNSTRLDALVAASLVTEESYDIPFGSHVGMFRYEYDAAPMIELLALVAETDDPDVKAAVFVAAVDALSEPLEKSSRPVEAGLINAVHRFDDGSGVAALHALAAVLLSDALGVFDALRLNADIYGHTTSDWFRELLREPGVRGSIHGEPLSHDGALAANQILAALMGEGLDPAGRAEFFQAVETTSGGLDDHVNAARLGYFAGTLSSGLDELGLNDDDDWIAVGIILGAAGLVDPTRVTSVAKFVESTVTKISTEIQDHNIAELIQEYGELERLIIEELLPRDGLYIYDGDAADEFFNTYDRVGGIVVGR